MNIHILLTESIGLVDIFTARGSMASWQHTKGMNPADARRFARAYYGWDDEPTELDMQDASEVPVWLREMAIPEELPFN